MSLFRAALSGIISLFRPNQVPHLTSLIFFLEINFYARSGCLTNAKELSLPYYLLKAGWRIIGFIAFTRLLVLCEMQSVMN